MQTVLANQQNSLNKLLELSKQDRILQLTQTKDTLNIDKKSDQQLAQLKKIDASIKDLNKSSNDKNKSGVNSNVIKLFTEIKKTTEQVKQLAHAGSPASKEQTKVQGQVQAQARIPLSKDQAKDITGKAMDRRQYRSIGDRVGEFKDKAKDFFTMRGFLDKTGIVKRGTGGVFSDMLDKREERQKYVASRLKMDPTARLHGTEKASKLFSRQFDDQQNIQRNIRKNESTLSTYKKQGFTEEQIKRTEESKKQETLATDLAKVDTRVRPQGFDPKTGLVKQSVISAIKPEVITEKAKPKSAKKQAEKNAVISAATPEVITEKAKPKSAKKQAAENNVVPIRPIISSIKPEVITEKAKPKSAKKQAADVGVPASIDTTEKAKPKSAKKQKATASAAVSSVISAIKPETITEKPQSAVDQTASTSVLSSLMPKKADKNAESAAAALTGEETGLEQNRKMDEQTEVLKKIESNTRGSAGGNKPAPKEESSAGGGIIDSILGFLGTGLMTAVKFLFSPKNLLKAFTKFFAPAMIIGSLINGIMDGFKVFSETGSIGEALIAGLGGVLSFLTFGLFDAQTIKNVVNAVSGFVTDYIVEPITKFFSFLGDSFNTYIKEPVMAAFSTVAGLFDEFIVQPLKTVFAPVTKFFSNLKDTIFGWFEGFEIPGISFSAFGEEFGFGPWHPFKKEDKAPVSGGDASAGSSAPPQNSAPKNAPNQDMSKSSISSEEAKNVLENGSKRDIEAFGGIEKLKQIASGGTSGTSNAGGGQGSSQFAATDPRRVDIAASNVVTAPPQATPVGVQNNGKAPPTNISTKTQSNAEEIAGEKVVPGQPLSQIQMVAISSAKRSGNNFSPEIEKQYKAQAAAIDSAKISPAASPQSGNAVAKGSEKNKEANMDASKPNSGGGNTIVSAPTVNNVQNTQQTIKLQPRNRDNSVSDYLSSRYAF